MEPTLYELQEKLRTFVKERDWDKFHNPKNLAMSLIVESAELVEIFQWLTPTESKNLDDNTIEQVRDEIADILIYLVRFCDVLEIDLFDAAFKKIKKNQLKYPAQLVKGSAKKYTELNDNGEKYPI
jgi:NTP pyrophosphatase (non-canonical NTP hydrolase)